MKNIILTFILVFSIHSLQAGEARIHGFFVQPALGYGATSYNAFSTQTEYDNWVQSMADVGAEMLFYQFSSHYWADQTWFSDAYGGDASADFAFYNPTPETINGISTRGWVTPTSWPGSPNTGGKEPIEYILEACQKAGVKLWLGLYINEDPNSYSWWSAVSDGTISSADQDIINHHVSRSISMVDDLYNQFGSHSAFGGFYYPIEVANVAFIPPQNYPILASLLDTVADAVHAKDNSLQLAISPFFNTNLAPADSVGAMWEYALSNSDLDIILLQDGVGVDPWALTESTDLISPYFQAVANAAQNSGKIFWGNSELATNNGTRMSPDFVPSDTTKILRQLRTEAPYVDKFVCFSFHYMDPNDSYTFTPELGGSASADASMRQSLYDQYKAYYDAFEPTTSILAPQAKSIHSKTSKQNFDLLGRSLQKSALSVHRMVLEK